MNSLRERIRGSAIIRGQVPFRDITGSLIVKEQRVMRARRRLCVMIAILLAVVLPVFAVGCGASTQQAAVGNYYKAITGHNWNAYLNSVLPENVRRMTSSDLQSAKKSFNENEVKYTGQKFKTIPDKSDKNKAAVEMTSGKVSYKDPNTGEKKSMTVEEIKRTYNVNATDKVVKYKGAWYVDVPMASVDMPTQQQ